MFLLLASSVGNGSKENGWIYPAQLSDRLAKYKNSEEGPANSNKYTEGRKALKRLNAKENLQTFQSESWNWMQDILTKDQSFPQQLF